MAAYAALVSIMQIIHQIEHHPFPPVSMDAKQVESLTEIVVFLQEFLEGYKSPVAYGDEADPLEMRIAEVVYAAEDAIESHIVDQILPAASKDKRGRIGFFNCFRGPKNDGWKLTPGDLYESLQKSIQDMDLIKKEVMEMVAVKDQLQRQVSSMKNSATSSLDELNNTTMVGFDDVMLQLMDKLTNGEPGRLVIPITGMGGIVKTTLARNIYEKELITQHFDICAWVAISQQFNTKELLGKIHSQVDKEGLSTEDDIGVELHKCLSYRRYLVVLDDMWSIEAWEELQCYFPDYGNGSRVMVTTRLSNLGSQLDSYGGLEMKFLDEQSSWDLLCKIVFERKGCPFELEKIGKKIAKSCKGLPLSIVVMGGFLEKLERTEECWESIRRSLSSLVNSENDNHCLKILKLSYIHLPVYLKPCFLYMGMFDEDREIRVSMVIKLWVLEGFMKPISGKSLETIAKEYLDELVDRNLILVYKYGLTGNVKYCKIHDLLRDLCLREAQKESFYHMVGQHSPQGTCSTLDKKVFYTGKVQLLPNLRLLRQLKAYDEYSTHVGKLFELVKLRHSGQLPSSINLLWSLQMVIVSNPKADVNAPVEIWNMPQLRHVQFGKRIGRLYLPDPPSDNIVIMENLQTLVGVKNFKCDENMVCRIPNIKKLGLIYHEDVRNESCDDDYCVHNIERLQKLESFSCFDYFPMGDFLQKLTFPHSLKTLTLEIFNVGMEYILEKVSTLPLLEKVKLSRGRFETHKWTTAEGQFPSLRYLSLDSSHFLECWMMESSHFPCLEHLHLCNVDLKEIPAELGEIPTLKFVVLENCSQAVVKTAKAMIEEQEELQGEDLSFKVAIWLWGKNEELQNLENPNFQVTVHFSRNDFH